MSLGTPAKDQPVICPVPNCGAVVEQKEGRGRPKLYCRPSHGELHRRRAASYGWL